MHHTERDAGRLRDIARGHARNTLFLGKADRGLDKVGPSFFDAQSGGHLSELSARRANSQFAVPENSYWTTVQICGSLPGIEGSL
ncbi:hypothetical protein FMUAM8_06490 [Nocardia cyriacigeorgica]|nr:hypothetical protein FMUAM8_06490 [Nocardia cyriacigeorgica]BDU04388.1 hypothetical protein FMUBM48_06510 [Nocardia cyriacigeorgica]